MNSQKGKNTINNQELDPNQASLVEEKNLNQEQESDKNKNIEKKEDKRNFFEKLFNLNSPEKKVELKSINDFNGAVNGINYFISIKDFKKAKDAIIEVENKERDAYESLIKKIDVEKEKIRQRKIYKKREDIIDKLKNEIEKKEIIYIENLDVEKFKAKFAQIKIEMERLIGGKKYAEALDLINTFFEENRESVAVIKFYNKWKGTLQKKFKKQLEEKERELAKNSKKEAETLIGESIEKVVTDLDEENKDEDSKNRGFFRSIINKINFYRRVQKKRYEKKLIDEVNLLIDTEKAVNEITKKSRVESMHLGLVKEISNDKLVGYELYAKILGKDKISGDAFGFSEDEKSYKFFLGDATGHGVKAGLIVTLITRLFYSLAKTTFLEKLVFEINNGLKQDLRSGNFITGLFFEINKANLNYIKYIGMGHEPILVYRAETGEIEKFISGGLAAGIRLIKDINQIKVRDLVLNDGDVIIIYSDGIVESRNHENELLGVDGLVSIVKKASSKANNIFNFYKDIIEGVKDFRGGNVNFFDDATIFMLRRNTKKDLVDKKSLYLKDLTLQENLSRKNIREFEGKTQEEIEKELERIRKEKQLNLILKSLETLYVTGEILKLKQESIRYIKEGFVHKKINDYLKKAISREKQYKIDLKDQKMKSKYKVLKEMLKKGDYKTVIDEVNEIIASDGNITI